MLRKLPWVLLAFACHVQAQEKDKDLFRDPQDGALDASEFLLDRKGFLPVPIVITEPAVGYGAGAALLFFRESFRERQAYVKPGERLTPPDVYIAALAGTENGTRVMGGGGLVTFDEDRWRWRGFIGLPDVNLEFYGVGGNTGTGDRKVAYNVDGLISTQQVMRRLGDTNNWIVGRWMYLNLDATFDSSRPQPIVSSPSRSVTSSGLGGSIEHDSRDNFFTASAGWKGSVEGIFYSPDWGSDNKYETYRAQAFGYLPLSAQFILGGRIDGRTSRGEVPFYQLPFVELRGVPVARYQDQSTAVLDTELRWNVTPRWALVGFIGVGRAWGSKTTFSDAGIVTAGGAGFRYLVARRLGIYAGLDLAKGPEDTAIYIQAGSAWR
ncbi:MAG TPA: glyceraldehyde-3-phosphate dehydrogenase [Burkholderiales bacterium]|nr:glyceraldehyde-3-phosphate dehydrogenase [Burkholderiales bacterium]